MNFNLENFNLLKLFGKIYLKKKLVKFHFSNWLNYETV